MDNNIENQGFDLEDILREFGDNSETEETPAAAEEAPVQNAAPEFIPVQPIAPTSIPQPAPAKNAYQEYDNLFTCIKKAKKNI